MASSGASATGERDHLGLSGWGRLRWLASEQWSLILIQSTSTAKLGPWVTVARTSAVNHGYGGECSVAVGTLPYLTCNLHCAA